MAKQNIDMDLRIVRNFLVGMAPEHSRTGEIEVSVIRMPRIGYLLLDVVYTPDKNNKEGAMLLQIDAKMEADEKYVAKQFVKQIQERTA